MTELSRNHLYDKSQIPRIQLYMSRPFSTSMLSRCAQANKAICRYLHTPTLS